MEVVTIGFPIVEVFKTHKLNQETLEAIKAWEKRQEIGSPTSSEFTEHSTKGGASSKSLYIKEVKLSTRSSMSSQRSDLCNMASLENALRTNPIPLLQFAALRDFSGENISFLTHLAEWRRSWLHLTVSTAQHRRQQFIAAVSIYAHFVSPSFSEFPINISHQNLTDLRDLFEEATSRIFRKKSITSTYSPTPFDDVEADSESTVNLRPGIKLSSMNPVRFRYTGHMMRPGYEDILQEFPIPEAFKDVIFDKAEKEIKYLVLTNTWPKFVQDAFGTSHNQADTEVHHRDWFKKKMLCAA